MAKLFTATTVVSALLLSVSAYALDVENQDATDYEVTIASGDGGPTTFKLKAGEIKRDVCGGNICNLMIDQKTGEFVSGINEHVVIKNGRLLMGKPRG